MKFAITDTAGSATTAVSERASRTAVRVSAIVCLAAYVIVYTVVIPDKPIRSDGFSYYVYLPAWFIFQDPTLRDVARDCCGGTFPVYTNIGRWPGTQRWVNAHPIGVAVMQVPFFLPAHLLTLWTNLSPHGFSLYYQHAAGLSGLFWAVAGLAILRRLLARQFSDRVIAATLLTVLLGTNLLHHAAFDSTFSHTYSFFLFAAFMYLTERWHTNPSRSATILLGIVAGLIVLVRHPNALFLLLFPLYGLVDRASLGNRPDILKARWRELAVIAIVAAALVAPQLAIYYQATGRFVVSAYRELTSFDFDSPRIAAVLFSTQKGLFFWTPLLLLAAAGLAVLRGRARAFLPGAVVFLAANTYLIASWFDWQFGDSFGHRGFTDSLPVFALGFASAFDRASNRPRLRCGLAVMVSIGVALNLFQMLQYWTGVLPMSDTTWSDYRRLFLRWPE